MCVRPQHPLLPLGASHAAMATRAKVRALAELINAGIQPLQNLTTTRKVKALGGDDQAWVQGFIASGLAAYEAAIAETHGRYSVGDAPTLADCCLIPQLYSARRFGVSLDPYPRLRIIDAACADDAAFQAAHPDRQPDAVA